MASDLLDFLDTEGREIVVPAPVITEVMCPITDATRRSLLLDVIQTRFRVAPLDDLSAFIAGGIWADHKHDWQDIYAANGEVAIKTKFKYDILILGISIAKGVDWLYTEDQQLFDLATVVGQPVRKLSAMPPLMAIANAARQAAPPQQNSLFSGQ